MKSSAFEFPDRRGFGVISVVSRVASKKVVFKCQVISKRIVFL